MVGTGGFEPPTPASRRRCSTRLSYVPVACRPLERRERAHTGRSLAAQAGSEARPAQQDGCNRTGATGPAQGELQCVAKDSISAPLRVGASPSGKAAVFGTAIPRFESWCPSQTLQVAERPAIRAGVTGAGRRTLRIDSAGDVSVPFHPNREITRSHTRSATPVTGLSQFAFVSENH